MIHIVENHFYRIKALFSDAWICRKSEKMEQLLHDRLSWWDDLGEKKQDELLECVWEIVLG